MIYLVIKYGKKPKLAFLDGIKEASNVVSTTIGPYGSNFIIGHNPIELTNSGYRIIKDLETINHISQLGVSLLTNATFDLYSRFHDGTSSFILIMCRMLDMVQRALNDGGDINSLNRAIQAIRPRIDEVLNRESLSLTPDLLPIVASTAAKDEDIGNLVANAFHEFGLGEYRIETGETLSYYFDRSIKLKTGMISVQMLKNAIETRVIDNPRVIIVNGRYDLSKLLENCPNLIVFNNLDDGEINNITRHYINCPNDFVAINVSNEELASIKAIGDFKLVNGNFQANIKQAIISPKETILEANNNYGLLSFSVPKIYNSSLVIERLEAAISSIINAASGVSLGQGISYFHLLDNIEGISDDRVLVNILEESLTAPYFQILENGFITNIEVGRPYDFLTNKFVSEDEFRIYQPNNLTIAIINQALNFVSDYLFIRGFLI